MSKSTIDDLLNLGSLRFLEEPVVQLVKQKIIDDVVFRGFSSTGRLAITNGNSTSADEMWRNLETDWSIVELGETGNFYTGSSINPIDREKFSLVESGVPFVATKDVGYSGNDVDYENGLFIPDDELSYRRAPSGALLLCIEGGSSGRKMCRVNQSVCFGNKLIANIVSEEFDADYLLWVYQSTPFRVQFMSRMSGIIGGVSKKQLLTILCPAPPIMEQIEIAQLVKKQIAELTEFQEQVSARSKLRKKVCNSILTSTFEDPKTDYSAIELVRENVETIISDADDVDALRRWFIGFIVGGKTTNLELAESSDDDLNEWLVPKNWSWIELGDLVETVRGISYGIIKLGVEPKENGVPVLRCSDVRFRQIDEQNIRTVATNVSDSYVRTSLQGGEVLVNIRGTLGGCAIVPDRMVGYNVAREVAVVPVKQDGLVSNEWVLAVLSSPYFDSYVMKSLRGIAYKGLNLSLLRKFKIPVPSKSDQETLLKSMMEFLNFCDQLKDIFDERSKIGNRLLNSTSEF
jgi:type I restriction enzyme S subunit